MPIIVGVNENLVISAAEKNEKGTLVVTVKEANEIDPLTALNASGSTQFNKAEKDFMFYPPTVTGFNGEAGTLESVLKKIAEVKDPLNHILEQYTASSHIKWDIFTGIAITKDNMEAILTNQDVLDKVYSNIADQFIRMITPFISDTGKKMRLLCIRQSKAKHFPSLRKRFLETYPFIEPMEIPVTQSKLKFSKFEMDNGLASGGAVGGQQNISEEDKSQAEALFTSN